MQNNVSSLDTCFTIEANNITLNCNGYTINYSTSSLGYAINNSGGYDNITIKNCNIVQGDYVQFSRAIYMEDISDVTIKNNTITLLWKYSESIYLYTSSSSEISYNTIITPESDGWLYVSTGTLNNISYNTIISTGNGAEGIKIDSLDNTTISNNNISSSNSGAYPIHLI